MKEEIVGKTGFAQKSEIPPTAVGGTDCVQQRF